MNAHPLVSLSGHPDAEVVNHFDLTEHLLEHNELTLTLESRSSRPRITGEVNLMIHPNE